jgi:uncharacterized integral membrane protein
MMNPAQPTETQTLQAGEAQPQEVIQQQVTNQDYYVLRIAVYGLILAVLVALVAVSLLAWLEKPLPDGVMAVGSAGVGALATMLVRPPTSKGS